MLEQKQTVKGAEPPGVQIGRRRVKGAAPTETSSTYGWEQMLDLHLGAYTTS